MKQSKLELPVHVNACTWSEALRLEMVFSHGAKLTLHRPLVCIELHDLYDVHREQPHLLVTSSYVQCTCTYGCFHLVWSGSGSMMQDHIKATSTSKELITPNMDSLNPLMHCELSDLGSLILCKITPKKCTLCWTVWLALFDSPRSI